uniref:Hfaza2D n=1 Tax=Hypoxylon fragiforme TaxID=63214 RepID=A0A7G6J4F9_9PEZI|nr:Hfaza2D [Hypoxylon fragiforme]
METRQSSQLQVAIVGGGIIGLITALGLLKRNVPVKIYEQARSFREIGAGVAFTANALKCMSLLDPVIVDCVNAVATPNGEDIDKPNDYLRYHDGYNWDPNDAESTDDKLLFLLYSGYKGFQGCHRANLLDELVKSIPSHAVEFGKRFTGYKDRGPKEPIPSPFFFHDADLKLTVKLITVIGCDGIKSKVRQLLLGEENPASYPHFTHKVAYRALIPMDQVEPVIGTFKSRNQHMHMGPRAHILHFPVAAGKLLNVVAFVTDHSDWPLGDPNGVGNMTSAATREDVAAAFEGWGPTVRKIVSLLPDNIDKWAIFDTYDHPATTFVQGRVCLAGDAAHASAPHHGAGAGIGVEDALALCTLLEKAMGTIAQSPQMDLSVVIDASLQIYNDVRPPRSQWLVQSSREVCDIYEWVYPGTQRDWDKCLGEITARSHKLWYFDIEGMLEQLHNGYESHFPAMVDSSSEGVRVDMKNKVIPVVS